MTKHIVDELLESGAYRVTRYLSPKLVVRATRIGGKHGFRKNGREPIDLRVKIGAPNYLERRFVKACLKAREPFPVKKDQFIFPKPKKAAKKGKSRGK